MKNFLLYIFLLVSFCGNAQITSIYNRGTALELRTSVTKTSISKDLIKLFKSDTLVYLYDASNSDATVSNKLSTVYVLNYSLITTPLTTSADSLLTILNSYFISSSGGGLSGSGTTNYLSKFTSASALGNSQIFDNGFNVGVNKTSSLNSKFFIKGFSALDTSYVFKADNGSNDPQLYIADGGAFGFGIVPNTANAQYYMKHNGSGASGVTLRIDNAINNAFSVSYGGITSSNGVLFAHDASNSARGSATFEVNSDSPVYTARFGSTSYADIFTIKFNGIVHFGFLTNYANNAAALSGGLSAGDIYYTDTAGEYILKIAH